MPGAAYRQSAILLIGCRRFPNIPLLPIYRRFTYSRFLYIDVSIGRSSQAATPIDRRVDHTVPGQPSSALSCPPAVLHAGCPAHDVRGRSIACGDGTGFVGVLLGFCCFFIEFNHLSRNCLRKNDQIAGQLISNKLYLRVLFILCRQTHLNGSVQSQIM